MRRLFTLKAEGSVLLRKLPPTKRKCDKGMRSLFTLKAEGSILFRSDPRKAEHDTVLRSLFTLTNSGLLFFRTRRNKQVAERAASPEGSLLVVSDRGETQA